MAVVDLVPEQPRPTRPLCKDCTYFWPVSWFRRIFEGATYAKCSHPAALFEQGESLVAGKMTRESQYYCSIMRQYKCGLEGNLWEPM